MHFKCVLLVQSGLDSKLSFFGFCFVLVWFFTENSFSFISDCHFCFMVF